MKGSKDFIASGCVVSLGLVAVLSFVAVIALLVKLIVWAVVG